MTEYGATALAGMPERVRVYEVGARDGLQNESTTVPTPVKAELIRRLVAAGHTAVETTSFVRAEWVPQLADAEALLTELGAVPDGVRMPVLVPNRRGLDRALAAGVREVAVFASATEAFARRNLNRGRDESLAVLVDTTRAARAEGLAVRGYVSMCFGDPWEGAVDPEGRRVRRRCSCTTPGRARSASATPSASRPPAPWSPSSPPSTVPGDDDLAVHFHDTYGQALSNTLVAALQHGITCVDSSAGGLGGCPYAKSATGNLATEDLVWDPRRPRHRHRGRPGRARRDQRVDGRAPRPPQPVPSRQRPCTEAS